LDRSGLTSSTSAFIVSLLATDLPVSSCGTPRGAVRSPGFRRPANPGIEILLQGDSIVVLCIVRAVNKRDRSSAHSCDDRMPRLRSGVEFPAIPPAELPPLLGIVT